MKNSCYSSEICGKKLLILGGNRISMEIVAAAKELGVFTYVLDWNPLENSPAKQIADRHYVVSIADTEAVAEIIEREKIDGIITGFADSYLEYYAKICERTGLPCYGTSEQFKVLSNKHIWKQYCKKHGVPTIDEYSENILHDESAEVRYPLLVKPSDNSGGRGVSICNNREELLAGYERAKEYSPSKTVLIERYITGTEATSFYVLSNGKVYLAGLGNRLIGARQEGVIGLPVGYSCPAENLDCYMEKVFPHVAEMFRDLGMKNGIVFMQNLIEDGVCHVYDIGYRLTGSLEYRIFEELYGYNTLKMLIHFALTGNMFDCGWDDSAITPYWYTYAYNITILAKPSKIASEEGADEILKIRGVFGIQHNHVPGEEIPQASKGTLDQIVLRVFCRAETEEELWGIVKEIKRLYKMCDAQGNNILLPVFDVTELHLRGNGGGRAGK